MAMEVSEKNGSMYEWWFCNTWGSAWICMVGKTKSTVCIFIFRGGSGPEGVHYYCLFCNSRMVVDFFLCYGRVKVSLDLVSDTYRRRLGQRSYFFYHVFFPWVVY